MVSFENNQFYQTNPLFQSELIAWCCCATQFYRRKDKTSTVQNYHNENWKENLS